MYCVNLSPSFQPLFISPPPPFSPDGKLSLHTHVLLCVHTGLNPSGFRSLLITQSGLRNPKICYSDSYSCFMRSFSVVDLTAAPLMICNQLNDSCPKTAFACPHLKKSPPQPRWITSKHPLVSVFLVLILNKLNSRN